MKKLSAMLHFKRYNSLPMVFQDEIAECGHACVAMISRYFGHKLGLLELRKIQPPSPQGITLRHINTLFIKLGFTTRALRISLEKLIYLKTPAILHWNMNHFVVLKKIKKQKAIIHDPASGVRQCSLQELSESFTGVVLEVTPSATFASIRQRQRLKLIDLIKLMPNAHRILGALLFLSLTTEFLALLNPFFIQYATDQAIHSHTLTNLYTVAFGFFLFLMLHLLSDYTREHLILYATTHFKVFFSANVFKHLLALPAAFFEARHQGDIHAKFQSIETIQSKISADFINTSLDGCLLCATIFMMFMYSRLLTLIVLGALGIAVLSRYASYHALKYRTAEAIHLHAKMTSFFLETLRVMTPIKLYLKENLRFHTWHNSYIDALNADILIARQNILYRLINQGLLHTEHIFVICVGIQLVFARKFTLGMLMAFLTFRTQLVGKATSFIQQIFDYRLISVQLTRLGDIVFQEPESTDSSLLPTTSLKGALTVDTISFQYHPNHNPILKKISFHIEAGEKVAIIGPSGCGKTTLLKIMLGLLEPTEGKILIDGIPIQAIGKQHYRSMTAAIMQYDSLLTGSILDNITFFDETFDLTDVYEAAKLAQIHDTIVTFPMGYETRLGEMGSSLSGGQKQRLLLARALYKKPKILFMDEATNHLDSENECLINQVLKTLDVTQIIVAHRQETIRMADRVVELQVL